MRFIPLAMTWEMLARGRWTFIAAALGANALPVLLYTSLRHAGVVEPEQQSQLTMHVAVVQINIFMFAAAVFGAQASFARLYAYPLPTSVLVAWRMLPAMAIVALESIISNALLNTIFGLGWPIWGPAMFAAASVAAFQAVLWLTEGAERNQGDALWVACALACLAAILGIWFKSRYGPPFSLPRHYWPRVTPGEVFTLLSMGVGSYVAAIKGVARTRCGDPPYSFGLPQWLARLNRFESPFDLSTDGTIAFGGPQQAQLWLQWRKNGWAMPAVSVFATCIWLIIWPIASRDGIELFLGFFVVGGTLSLAGFLCGLMIGNLGASDKNLEIGSFLATRPMTNTDMARTILRTAAKSLLIAWCIWAALFLVLWLICRESGVNSSQEFFEKLRWWYFPGTLLGAWTVMGVMVSAGLAGRHTLILKSFVGLFFALFATEILASVVLSQDSQRLFWQGVTIVGGATFLLGTVWAFAAAQRRTLIGVPTLYVASFLWGALCTLDVIESVRHPSEPIAVYIFAAGILALSLAPLATAPLALAWNRTR